MKQKRTVEDYLKTIYSLRLEKGSARGTEIAERLGVSRPTVSVALKSLQEEGYLLIDGGHEIHLTEKGYEIAVKIYERHRTLTGLLMEIGVDEQTALADACRMEHALGEKSYNALKTMIGKGSCHDN